MQYQVVLRQRNIPDQELLDDLKRVAALLGNAQWVTYAQYEKYGIVAPNTIKYRFGSWENALVKAGFSVANIRHKQHWHCPSKQALIEDIQAVAKQLNTTTITSTQYEQYGKYGRSCAHNYFGAWANVIKAADLSATGFHTAGITDAELFEDIANVWLKLGRQPSYNHFRRIGLSKYGATTYARRFGSWNNALLRFVEAMQNAEQDSDLTHVQPQPMPTDATDSTHAVPHNTPREVNYRLRYKVMMRDHCRCCICGKSPATHLGTVLEIDHIYPYSKGGETILENLQTLCKQCNLGKSDLI